MGTGRGPGSWYWVCATPRTWCTSTAPRRPPPPPPRSRPRKAPSLIRVPLPPPPGPASNPPSRKVIRSCESTEKHDPDRLAAYLRLLLALAPHGASAEDRRLQLARLAAQAGRPLEAQRLASSLRGSAGDASARGDVRFGAFSGPGPARPLHVSHWEAAVASVVSTAQRAEEAAAAAEVLVRRRPVAGAPSRRAFMFFGSRAQASRSAPGAAARFPGGGVPSDSAP